MQKISLFHLSILQRVNFRVPSPDWPHPFLTMLTQKIFNHLLICVKLYQHTKISKFHQFFLEMQSVFDPQRPEWTNSFLTMRQQKRLNQLLIFVICINMQKKEAVSLICSGKMLGLKKCSSQYSLLI